MVLHIPELSIYTVFLMRSAVELRGFPLYTQCHYAIFLLFSSLVQSFTSDTSQK
jgi:hypothetical protein